MTTYKKEELQEALRAVISTNNKCEKALLKLNQPSAQRTLLERRTKAFRISVSLIEKELSALEQHSENETTTS